ncbi:unnamed protein product [Strongylus vulgaris]|uniref:Uncharacterized protein n=1 Tax=Strongylus vulgaris TaxID=40348 RepID=A0A3P7IN29_STRVU|nr:unnamed protein product [Strongylus vulgaris]
MLVALFSGKLFSHCLQYDHPSAIVANLIVTLVRLNQLDSARLVFLKHALQIIEDFANLVTDCMFAEKRRMKKNSAQDIQSTFLSPDLLLVLDCFCGTSKRKQVKASAKNEKKKFHRVNDMQLFELTEFLQNIWLKEAEKSGDTHSVDRLVAWTMVNRLELTPKFAERIAEVKSRTTSSSSPHS